MTKNVLVLFGGQSPEHPVSIVTAAGVLNALDINHYTPIPVGINPDGDWVLAGTHQPAGGEWSVATLINEQPTAVTHTTALSDELPEVPATNRPVALRKVNSETQLIDLDGNIIAVIDVVFPLLHGPNGEDGTVQGVFETLGIPYVGAGVLASAVGMDKHFMKIAFQHAGLKVGPWVTISDAAWRSNRNGMLDEVAKLDLPLFVKPARGGSSLGIRRVTMLSELEDAIEYARQYDPKVVVEAGILGREIECGVLDGANGAEPKASYPGEIVVTDDLEFQFYDFTSKYQSADSAELSCPADLPADVTQMVREQSVRAFQAVDGAGLSRVDFFYTDDEELVINEINTMPGFTPISMYPQMWQRTGIEYPELIDTLLELALQTR
ncbi:D-alanine--D-alanine ligase family protein [Yaniella soli]|uniref:D-alanine--D-alanine ligase family protein n=1 Tax=Yaniella flava TaxID=287930 RepID=UPI0031D2DAFB